jgi:surface antigen
MRTLDSNGLTWSSWGQYQVFTISNSTSTNPVDDYPSVYKNSTHCDHYAGSTYCPGICVPDVWNFYRRECTSFVAWRINRDAGNINLTTSDPFQNNTVFDVPVPGNPPRLSDAVNWAYKLQLMGYAVNNTPYVGDIAYFNYGHVAYVNSVNQNGTVNIEEYNMYTNCNNIGIYSYRTTRADKYIHIRQGTGGSNGINDEIMVKLATIIANPTNTVVNISFSNPQNSLKKIAVINTFGTITKVVTTYESILTIDLTKHLSGLYLILIEIDGKIEAHKIIKQ